MPGPSRKISLSIRAGTWPAKWKAGRSATTSTSFRRGHGQRRQHRHTFRPRPTWIRVRLPKSGKSSVALRRTTPWFLNRQCELVVNALIHRFPPDRDWLRYSSRTPPAIVIHPRHRHPGRDRPYFLHLTVKTRRPVVITGLRHALRPRPSFAQGAVDRRRTSTCWTPCALPPRPEAAGSYGRVQVACTVLNKRECRHCARGGTIMPQPSISSPTPCPAHGLDLSIGPTSSGFLGDNFNIIADSDRHQLVVFHAIPPASSSRPQALPAPPSNGPSPAWTA